MKIGEDRADDCGKNEYREIWCAFTAKFCKVESVSVAVSSVFHGGFRLIEFFFQQMKLSGAYQSSNMLIFFERITFLNPFQKARQEFCNLSHIQKFQVTTFCVQLLTHTVISFFSIQLFLPSSLQFVFYYGIRLNYVPLMPFSASVFFCVIPRICVSLSTLVSLFGCCELVIRNTFDCSVMMTEKRTI